ncbi:DUF4331 family protein [Rugosimonospora africana]|uniref:DUF4331 domain-containing protein n=1 Tax=Rugosimonospora africana TaxID=556532 RepID=A0A8J3QRL4_9ACTN|nr:DUF4331 family protein [Rugosimonospora africana]GIH16200.1 hypothetical protein Raf01_43720 [Rugosimonospora africana]
MSHHLDSPLSLQDTRLNLTDQFVFPGESGTVFIMDVNSSAAGSDAKPGFHPEGRYEFKIHRNASEVEDLTYRVSFEEADGDGEQALRLTMLTGSDASDDGADGETIAEGRTNAPVDGVSGMRAWAGRVVDPFYIDLNQLATIEDAVKNGKRIDSGDWRPDAAKNSFNDATVHSIVLEVPDDDPNLGSGTDIACWISTQLATDAGGWRQINREGHPMVWPIFRQLNDDWATNANTRHPDSDAGEEGSHIAELIAGVVAANGTCDDPAAYGRAVARRLLPDVMPYRIGTPASYGFLGFNGRALSDNAPEAMFSLVMNAAITTGLSPAQFSSTRSELFPYVVSAH